MTDETETPQVEDQSSGGSIGNAYQKLDLQDRIVLFGTAGAFLFGFLPWYSSGGFGSSTFIGFDHWHGKVFFLTCLATPCLLLLPGLRQQLFEKLSPGARALTIPALTAATLIFGPVFFRLDFGSAFAGPEGMEVLVSAGRTGWFLLAFLASAAAAGSAALKWKQSAASS